MPVIELALDSSKAVKGLNQYDAAVDKSAVKTDTAFSKMRGTVNDYGAIVVAGMAAAGAAIFAFSLKVVTMASSLVEAQGIFDQAFNGMSDTAEQWAKELGASYHLSETVAKQSLSTFQLVLRGMDVATVKAGEMSNALVRVGADLGAAFDRKTVDVVNDIRSALSGSMEVMDKYGVVIRSAQINQKALEMGLAATTAELTQADKATATYNLILEKTALITGTTARESAGYAGQLKEAKKNIDNLVTGIGTQLMPAFTAALKLFNEWISAGDRQNKIINTTIEIIRALVNGYFGLEMVLKGTIVVVAGLFEGFTKLLTPMKVLLDGLNAIGVTDYNPIKELQQVAEDFTKSAIEGFGTTIEKVDSFNAAMDKSKIKVEAVTSAVIEQKDIAAPAIAEVAAKVKEELIPEEEKLKDEIKKVTEESVKSTAALNSQAAAATKVAAATKKIAESTPGGTMSKTDYAASAAWSGGTKSMGSAPAMTPDEMAYYQSMTPGGRGDHYWDSGKIMGPMGYGKSDDIHSNLDRNLAQSSNALKNIMDAKDQGTTINVFNQNLSRSDITQLTNGQFRNEARA